MLVRVRGTGRAAGICVLAVSVLGVAVAQAEPPEDQVRAALTAMHRWVGSGPNGQHWRAYLQSERLAAELDRGAEAEAGVLQEVLDRYGSSANGLDAPRFVAVRQSLRRWLEELRPPAAAELVAAARRSKSQFGPISPQELQRERAGLLARFRELGTYLATGGENGAAWKRYLKWEQLRGQLKADAKPRLEVLVEVYRRYTANHVGLALSRFTRVGNGLRRYLDRVAMAQLKDGPDRFAKETEALAESLKRYTENPTEEDHRMIGQRLGWLEGGGQLPELVRGVRRRYSHPNLVVQASAELVAVGMRRPLDRTDPVRDIILGTRIRGQARTIGTVSARLVPDSRRAVLETVLQMSTASRTVGRNGPVWIHADGQTRIRAIKRLVLDDAGLRSFPATSRATTSSTVRGVATRHGGLLGKFIRKQAYKQIGRSKWQAEIIAARHAERRVNQRVDAESGTELAKANRRFLTRFRRPLLRRRAFPQTFHWRTTRDHLHLTVLQASPYQIGAPGRPPELDGSPSLAVRVHESMINNLAALLLAGRTFTDEDAGKLATQTLGEIPEKLQPGENDQPWSITFARRQPVTIALADGGFRLTIRGTRYTSGERSFKAMNITAVYKIKRTDGRATLLRQGDLEILPPRFVPGQSRLSASQVALRRLISKRLGKLFEAEIVGEGLKLPGRWGETGPLTMAQLSSRDGWLAAAWQLPGAAKVALAP